MDNTILKKRLKYLLLLQAFYFCWHISYGQQPIADSLLNLVNVAQQDTTKVNAYNQLFLEYEFSDNGKAQDCLNKALALAQKSGFKKGLATTYIYLGYFAEDKSNYPEALKNYRESLKIIEAINDKKGIAFCYNNIGVVYYYQGNYEDALKSHFASLKIKLAIDDKKGIAASYNNIGNVYFVQGNYQESVKNYFACLKMYKILGHRAGIIGCYNNIANVYSDQGNYPEALKNYFTSLKMNEEDGNKKGEAMAYNNIGAVYYNQGNYADALKKYSDGLKIRIALGDKTGIATTYSNIGSVYSDLGNLIEALKNHELALKIREEIGDKAGIGDSYNNIGLINYNQASKEKNIETCKNKIEQSLENYFSALKMREAIGDKTGIAGSCYNIGNAFIRINKFAQAEVYLLNAIRLSTEIGYKQNLIGTYKALSDLDSAKGNFKGAYEYHKLHIAYRDSLDNEETRKKTIQSQMTFDFEKKEAIGAAEHKKELENQEALADEKSRKQKVIIVFVVFGLLLVLTFSGFIFRSLRITRKQKHIIELQKNVVEQQKQEVELQKNILEEHQKEIIDSITYARRIQRSLLPTEKYIEKNMNRLRKI